MPGTEAQDGEVLLDALRRIHPDSSTGTLRRMLTQGRVQVDGTTVHAAKAELTSGQHVGGRGYDAIRGGARKFDPNF